MNNLPTYPIMIVTEEFVHGCFGATCCCGHKFQVDPCDGDNLVSHKGTMYECCPNCYGLPAQSREEHLVYLACIKQMLDRARNTYLTMGKSCAGWYYSQAKRIDALIDNANAGASAPLILKTDTPFETVPEEICVPRGLVGENILPALDWTHCIQMAEPIFGGVSEDNLNYFRNEIFSSIGIPPAVVSSDLG